MCILTGFTNAQLSKVYLFNIYTNCPKILKDGKCPFDGKAEIDLSRLHECPAFKEGCPYKTITAPTAVTSQQPPAAGAHDAPQTGTGAGNTTHSGDAAKCPFSSMHGKVENPHK